LCIFNLCKILLFSAMYNVRLSLFFRIQKQVSYLKMRNCEAPLFKKNPDLDISNVGIVLHYKRRYVVQCPV
jgi:hypothetical protein